MATVGTAPARQKIDEDTLLLALAEAKVMAKLNSWKNDMMMSYDELVSLADEVVVEAMVKFDPSTNVSFIKYFLWLYKRRIIDQCRRNDHLSRRERSIVQIIKNLKYDVASPFPKRPISIEGIAEQKDKVPKSLMAKTPCPTDRPEVERLMSCLTKKQRSRITLRYLLGYTAKEIASMENSKRQTVEIGLVDALKKMRKMVKEPVKGRVMGENF